jgi:hypothetical protein
MPPRPDRLNESLKAEARSFIVVFCTDEDMGVPLTTGFPAGSV